MGLPSYFLPTYARPKSSRFGLHPWLEGRGLAVGAGKERE